MYNPWTVDLSDSVEALNSIKETVLAKLISGKIHTVECSDNEILMLLDQKSGVDYIRENETGLQGIAARVQWVGDIQPYNTFTIRKERKSGAQTEFEKRMQQIEQGYFYPAFTLQAYFDNRELNKLKSIAIVGTKKLYEFIKQNINNPDKVYTNKSDNTFLYVHWSDLTDCGVKIYPREYVTDTTNDEPPFPYTN